MSVALAIQHAKRMRRIAICGVSGCTVYFQIYHTNGTNFGRGGGERERLLNINACFHFLNKRLSETFLILSRIGRDIIINIRRSSP